MVQQIKYSMQPTFMTRLTELIDDEGRVVMVDGKPFQKKKLILLLILLEWQHSQSNL